MDLGSRGLYYLCSEKRHCTTDKLFCFLIANSRFSHDAAQHDKETQTEISTSISHREVSILGLNEELRYMYMYSLYT